MTEPTTLTALTDAGQEQMHATYRYLHAHPELSMQEYRTAEFIAAELIGLGIENFSGGGTGVVGILRNGDGPVVAFRADAGRDATLAGGITGARHIIMSAARAHSMNVELQS